MIYFGKENFEHKHLDMLFIALPFDGFHKAMPIGILAMAEKLDSEGYTIGIWDYFCDESISEDDLFDLLQCVKIDNVAISLLTGQISYAEHLVEKIKKHAPDTYVICGGLHFSATRTPIEAADVCIAGEGEDIVQQLIAGYRPEEKLLFTPNVKDLEDIPLPGKSIMQKYNACGGFPKIISMVSRGCPYRCTFCLSPSQRATKVRRYSTDAVVSFTERAFEAFDIKTLFYVDDIFTIYKDWLLELCDKFRQRGLDKFEYHCFSHANIQDAEIYEAMGKAGFKQVQLGLESGDEEVLKRMKKKFPPERARRTVQMIKDNGMQPFCLFILGFAGDTLDSMNRTLEYAESLETPVWFSLAQPIPGTDFADMTMHEGIRLHDGAYDVNNQELNYLPEGVTYEQMESIWERALVIRRNSALKWAS